MIAATEHGDLPAEPLTRADLPPDSRLRLGSLGWYRGQRGRPFLHLVIRCLRCGTFHRHPWRWDWGLSAHNVSFQAARCWRGTRLPYWLALDPARADHNAAVHAEARGAFLAWAEEVKRRRDARIAEARAESERTEALNVRPLWMGPVGSTER